MGIVTGTIEATLLYPAPPRLAGASLLDAVNAGLQPFGLWFWDVPAAPGEALALSNGAMRVALRPVEHPLPGAEIAAALGGSYTRLRPNDYAGRVAAHKAAVRLDVCDVRDARPEPIPEATMVVVAHAVVAAAKSAQPPLVIHWRQSDMLVLPEEVPPLRGIGFPASLVTRPEIVDAGRDSGGRLRLGVTAALSERYFGKTVTVEPTAHPLDEVLSLIDFCLLKRLAGEELLTDGATLGLPGPVEVTVRHRAASADHPAGSIALSLRAAPPRANLRRTPAPAVIEGSRARPSGAFAAPRTGAP